MLVLCRRVLRCAVQPGPVGLLMTDDLLVVTQGGDQCDVRPSSGPPEQPRTGTDALSQHVSGAAAVPLLLAASRSGKPRSLGTAGHLGVPLRPCLSPLSVRCRGEAAVTPGHHNRATRPGARCQENYLPNKATVSTILRCAQPCRTDPKPDRAGPSHAGRAHLGPLR